MFFKSLPAPMKLSSSFHARISKHPNLQSSLDHCGPSGEPSILERSLMAVLGLSMLIAGPFVFLLNLDNQGWSWAFALITTWSGMALLLLLGHSGCRVSELFGRKDTEGSVHAVATDTTYFNPIMETLAELGRATKSRSAILLSAEGATWCFRIGWNSSKHVGAIIARLLEGRVPRDAQSLVNLSLMDGALSAFCTPMHLNSGHSFLLVLLNDVKHTMPNRDVTLAFQTSLKIIGQIGCSSHVVQAKEDSDLLLNSQAPLCCSVCDCLSTQDGRWISRGDWLYETHGIIQSYTFCDNCSEWIYGLDSSQGKTA
jgi:hypothetical protein